MTKRFNWIPRDGGFRCELPGNVTLFASPDRTKGFDPKPVRGTTWRAGATHWDAATSCASRFGRDVYGEVQPNAKAAQRLAEAVYLAAAVS